MPLVLSQLVRQNILQMQAYDSARSIAEEGRILLDANEAPAEDGDRACGLNRYPSPQPPELRQRLAELYQVEPNQICMGRGADEAIDLLVRATCEPGRDAILTCPPTYGMYRVAADIQGASHIPVPMLLDQNQFKLDVDGLRRVLISERVKLLFLCRPNNPTGEIVTLATIEQLAALAGPSTLVVVDEAYLEFAQQESAAVLIANNSNVVVLRTFSKAWALAGARFGVAIASPELATVLAKVRAPYPISSPVEAVINRQLDNNGAQKMRDRIGRINNAREQLRHDVAALRSVAVVYPSAANYLLVRVPGKACEVFRHLRNHGIVVRDRSTQALLNDCLRITVGTPADHQALIAAWQKWETAYYV